MQFKSISTKLVALISIAFLISFAIYTIFAGVNMWKMNKTAEEESALNASEILSLKIRDIFQQQLDSLENEARTIAALYEKDSLTSDFLLNSKRAALLAQESVFSTSLLFNKGIVNITNEADEQFVDASGRFVPYLVNVERDRVTENPFGDYEGADWYEVPMKEQKPFLTAPYEYDVGNGQQETIMTLTYPVISNGKTIGYVSSDSTLAALNKLVAQETPETGYQFIVTDSGTIAADTKGKYFNEPIKNLTAHAESNGIYTTNKAIDGEVFQVHVDTTFRQLDTHWDIVTILPKKTILGPVYQSIAYLVIGAIFMVIALIFMMRIIINKQLRPLKNVKEQLGLAAEGNLQAIIDAAHVSEDEIGQVAAAYNQMLAQTSSVVRQVQQASSTLQGNAANTFGAIQKIAIGNDESVEAIQEIAKGAHHQSEEMETTLRNMQMLSEAIAQVEAISNQMDERAKQSIIEVQVGLEQIAALKRSQQMTDQSNEQLSVEMNNLVQTMGEITKIVDTIDEISAQTNLLSLNASIEAARAGEHGKGFAVVAEEVRQLAEQTQVETHRIQEMIQRIQQASQDTMAIATQTSELITTQSAAVGQAEQVFKSQSDSSYELEQRIDVLIAQLQQMEQQKLKMLEEIQAVVTISEESAAVAEEVSANAVQQNEDLQRMKQQMNEVNTLSDELLDSVSTFKLT